MSFYTLLYIIIVPEHLMTKHLVKTIEECYYKALYYVGSSLSCLQYFKNDKNIKVCYKWLAFKIF